MTTSGTYTFGDTEQIDIITEAYERVGRLPSTLASNDIDSARRSINYMFSDWANNGPNLWAVDLQSITLTPGTLYYDLQPRTVSILQVYTRTTSGGINTDLMMSPISRAEYDALPNKAQEGDRPFQYYFERTITPRLYIWQVPQAAGVTLFYHRMKIQEDAGDFTNSMDAPNRWMEAIAAGLAAKLAVKFAPDRLSFLQGLADGSYERAAAEDREKVPLRITIDMQEATKCSTDLDAAKNIGRNRLLTSSHHAVLLSAMVAVLWFNTPSYARSKTIAAALYQLA
jgi:hypothetical protein